MFLEQRGRNHVDAFIRALRREDRRHEQLEWISKIQLATRTRINLREGIDQLHHPLACFHLGIIRRPAMDSMQGIMSQSAQVLDRRPIATRDRKWARVTASWLASRRVSPNAISLAGMFACYRGGNRACGDVDRLSPNRMADRSALLRIYFAIAHRLTITGRENLPAHGPFVLAANHGSHLDALTLGATLTPHQSESAFPIAAGDVFFQTNVTSTFSAIMLNALPMWRKDCGPRALSNLRRKLQEEKSIFIIFPQGARSRDGSMMPFKHGLGTLVAETNVPVVPCGLAGAFEALPPDRKLPRPGAIKLVIGGALEFASTANNRTGWSQVAASVESPVRALVAQSRAA